MAAGARPNFFGVPGAAEHAFPLYSVADAERLRLHLQQLLQEAMAGRGPAEPGALDVVVVGGGPTGVETTGALAELMQALQSTGRLDPAGKITLVDRGIALLGAVLRARRTTTPWANSPRPVRTSSSRPASPPSTPTGSSSTTSTTHPGAHRGVGRWGIGLGRRADGRAGPRAAADGSTSGPTSPSTAIPGVYAVGDVANIPSGDDGAPTLPQLGSVAQQSGRWAAENILRERGQQPTKPFQYKDKGIMAMIGRNAAVAEVGKHRHQVEGPLAFAAWLGVHAMLLSGAHSKTDAFLTWAWDYFDRDHAATVEASSAPQRIAWGDDDQDVPHISLDRPQPADTPAAT